MFIRSRILLFLFLLLIVVNFVACKCRSTYKRKAALLSLATIGIKKADIDSAILISYLPDGTFSKKVDQNTWLEGGYYMSLSSTDSFLMNGAVSTSYDWKLIFPTLHKTFLFTKVSSYGDSTIDQSYVCSDKPSESNYPTNVSCNINGVPFVGTIDKYMVAYYITK